MAARSVSTFPKGFTDVAGPNQTLITAGVVRADPLAGTSSLIGKTGVFIRTATLSGWLVSGSGRVLSTGLVLSEGLVFGEH